MLTPAQLLLNFEDTFAPEKRPVVALPWISVAPHVPYFITETGEPWTPIGQNDAITWPELSGIFRCKNVADTEKYMAYLVANGVNCMRLMLEYCHTDNRYLERPAGKFQPNMVSLWDDLFALCEMYGLRILLTPFDTFWMRKRWRQHPYNRLNGGPCTSKSQWLVCKNTLEVIKGRLAFVTERWGNSGVLFAWDLWNEPDPVHAGNKTANIAHFVTEISDFLRKTEIQLYGRAHLQTVSAFGPHLLKHKELAEVFFRHPSLDFASIHLYDNRAIDNPKNTVAPALAVGEMVRKALLEIKDNRPFFDSEHGPIRAFRKRQGTLPEHFDDEYFRHIQWAHFASGGAGGGMRWPYRHPHRLTDGMRQAQKNLSGFVTLVNWISFQSKNLSLQIKINHKNAKVFACGNHDQVILWLLLTDILTREGVVASPTKPIIINLVVPDMVTGLYMVYFWDTLAGKIIQTSQIEVKSGQSLILDFILSSPDIALLVKRNE